MARDHLELTEITCLPSGRGIAAGLNSVWMVNIYAPSGAQRRREREEFYAVELLYLMRTIPGMMIMEGDFIRVLVQVDYTGKVKKGKVPRWGLLKQHYSQWLIVLLNPK
jgi:hypothetical protein